MVAPFASLESRLNAAVVDHLANATAVFSGGVEANGVFRTPVADAFGMAGERPVFESLASLLSGVEVDDLVEISGKQYSVVEVKSITTGGMITLVLEES